MRQALTPDLTRRPGYSLPDRLGPDSAEPGVPPGRARRRRMRGRSVPSTDDSSRPPGRLMAERAASPTGADKVQPRRAVREFDSRAAERSPATHRDPPSGGLEDRDEVFLNVRLETDGRPHAIPRRQGVARGRHAAGQARRGGAARGCPLAREVQRPRTRVRFRQRARARSMTPTPHPRKPVP